MTSTSDSLPSARLLLRAAVVVATCIGASVATAPATYAHHRPDDRGGRFITTTTTFVATSTTTGTVTTAPATTTTSPAATTTTTEAATVPTTPESITQEIAVTASAAPPTSVTAGSSTSTSTAAGRSATANRRPARSSSSTTTLPSTTTPSSQPLDTTSGTPPTATSGELGAAAPKPATTSPQVDDEEPAPGSVAIGTGDQRLDGAVPVARTGDMLPAVKVLLGLLAMVACFAAVLTGVRGRRPRVSNAGLDRAVTEHLLRSTAYSLADGGTPDDPSAARIGGRLVALVAVAARVGTECGGRDVREARDRIIRWVDAARAGDEVEDVEEAILLRLPGTLDDADVADGSWQIEGAVVLAWALGLLEELPPYDEAVNPTTLSEVLGFPDAERTGAVLQSVDRRHRALVDAEAERYDGIHRRLKDFVAMREALDLESFTRGGQPGRRRFEQVVPLVGGDMAVAGRQIGDADPRRSRSSGASWTRASAP